MLNEYDICINTTNYAIFNMQGFRYLLCTFILNCFWLAGIPTVCNDRDIFRVNYVDNTLY